MYNKEGYPYGHNTTQVMLLAGSDDGHGAQGRHTRRKLNNTKRLCIPKTNTFHWVREILRVSCSFARRTLTKRLQVRVAGCHWLVHDCDYYSSRRLIVHCGCLLLLLFATAGFADCNSKWYTA